MLRDLQSILVEVLLAEDPVQSLRKKLEEPGLAAEDRDWLRTIDEDGLRVTGLLVKKLRFERLTRGDAALAGLFQEQPDLFMRLFKAYAAEIPPSFYFPSQEQAKFREWKEKNASRTNNGTPREREV